MPLKLCKEGIKLVEYQISIIYSWPAITNEIYCLILFKDIYIYIFINSIKETFSEVYYKRMSFF